MSFSFDRPNLRDRTRGKSGDEFLEEMLKNMKQKNRNFFDSHPKWKTSGFSFDDDVDREGSAGGSRSNLKSHLADIVARHPELADTFVDLLPEGPSETKENRQKSEPFRKDSQQQTADINKSHYTTTQGTQTGCGLESDIKLRNTVPDMQSTAQNSSDTNAENDRAQRSQSAPPQAPSTTSSKQKEEGIRLIPIRTDAPHPGPQMPTRPQQQHSQNYQHGPSQNFQQTPQQFPDQRNQEERGPTVRHIPIFVEGRDEPILPKDATPLGMKRGGCQGKAESTSGKRSGGQPEEKRQQQSCDTEPQPQPQHQHQQQQQAPAQPQPPSKPDPLAQVAEVLKEVEELAAKVNECKGKPGSEKEYIYLDEMLTRNLLKLDNIETEGREEVRTARKDVIRRIQAAISVLESLAAQGSENKIQSDKMITEESTSQVEPMETDASNTVEESSEQPNPNSQSSQT